ncbi:MAG: alpha/beta fold hydrolase [Alphaproteobacteria bacterium]|nr:alpha/beta fold hydrolase [Alphaproteobacteria bacterium]
MSTTLTVPTDGARIAVTVTGEGPPILWVQGSGVTGAGWTPQVARFAASHTCAVFDNRGIGASTASGPITVPDMARDAIAVLDALGWSRAWLVGHSLGGLICQEVAMTAPSRVRAMLLSCTFSRGPEATGLRAPMVWWGLRSRVGTRAMRRQGFLGMVAPPDQRTPEVAARLAPLIGRDLADSPPVLMAQVRAMAAYDRADALGSVEVPALVQSATDDVVAPPVFGQRLAASLPRAVYRELPGTHAHTLLDPAPFDALVADWLATT